MNLASILTPERTCCDLEASSKKRAIEEAAGHIARTLPRLDAAEIYENLINREKLGTTAIGHGIAIPHCRMQNCDEIVGGLFKLRQPINFEAFDDQPVQIMFVLLVPAEEVEDHLATLAMLAERFESEKFREHLLQATSDRELYERATQDPVPNARLA
ncbi:MAG: PTS sugar transporter subunit IIA [Pseudomonadales bacterium]